MADLPTDRRDQPSASPAPSVGVYDSFGTEEERVRLPQAASCGKQTVRRAWRMRDFYILLAPAVVLLFVFKYIPMYGVGIAFVDYNIVRGVSWAAPGTTSSGSTGSSTTRSSGACCATR